MISTLSKQQRMADACTKYFETYLIDSYMDAVDGRYALGEHWHRKAREGKK